jgi:hypothetical protein
LVDGDVIGSVEFSKISRAILVELRITTSMLKKTKRRVAQLEDKKVKKALKGALEEALQQIKGEAAALKKRLASDPEAIRILVKARENLACDCKTFVVSPGEKAWKECTARLGMLVDSWAAVRGAIMAAVEELRGEARDTDLLGGTKSAVILARLLRGALSELFVLMKALGEMQEQVQGMEGVEGATKVVVEATLKKARGELKAMLSELKEASAEQILEGAELQQLKAEAAVDEGAAILDFADIVLSGVSSVPGLSGVCSVLKSVVGVGRKVHELAEDALKMTESAFEIGRYLIDMERMAMRMEEGRKAELQYHMSSLRELVEDMQEAIMVFGRKGFFRKMLLSAKLARKVTTIERRKEAILKAMDRILQTVQTELMLDTKEQRKEHTYALVEAVWTKIEEHTKAKGGNVDVEADVSEAAEEIMRDPDTLQEVADSAGLSEEVFKEEMELIHEKLEEIKGAVRGEGIQTRAEMDVHYARSAQARLDDKKVELSRLAGEYRRTGFGFDDLQGITTAETRLDELLQHPSGFMGDAVLSPTARIVKELQAKGVSFDELQSLVFPSSSSDGVSSAVSRKSSATAPLVPYGADGSEIYRLGADTVGVFCCHIPHTDSHSSEVAGASRVEGEKKVLVAIEGARILSPASIESMEDAIAQSNPRGVHIAGHNQVQFVHMLLILALISLPICSTAPTRCGSSASPASVTPTAIVTMGMISSPSAHLSCSPNTLWTLHSQMGSGAGWRSWSSMHVTRFPSLRYAIIL